MLCLKNDYGRVNIYGEVFSTVTGVAAMNCFGVKGMAMRSVTDGLVHLLKKESVSKGVLVTKNEDNSISVELHIIVDRGVNIAAVCNSIMNEVKYVVETTTGIAVKDVNIFVDMVVAG